MTYSSLTGRLALVTGAELVTGASIASELARRGAAVAIQYLDSFAQARTLVRGIEQADGQAVAVRADLRDPAQAELLCKKAVGAFGDLDIAVAVEPADGSPQPSQPALCFLLAALHHVAGRGRGTLVYVGDGTAAAVARPAGELGVLMHQVPCGPAPELAWRVAQLINPVPAVSAVASVDLGDR